MANTLTSLIVPLRVLASAVEDDIANLQTLLGPLNDQISPTGHGPINQLFQQKGSFSGPRALAFQEAAKVHSDITDHLMSAFTGTGAALTTFGDALDALNGQYDRQLAMIKASDYAPNFFWNSDTLQGARMAFAALHPDTTLIDDVIASADGNAVLLGGATDLLNLLSNAYLRLVEQAASAPILLPTPDALTPSAKQTQARQMVVAAIDALYNAISPIYSDWGTGVQQAFFTFHSAMNTVDEQVQPYTDLLTDPTDAVSLFDLIHEVSGLQDPIAIVQTGPNNILVMVSGLQMGNLNYDTNIWNALGAGMGQRMPYEQDVIDAIRAFCAEHGLANPAITLAGHSLGGIVDQEVAEDERNLGFDIRQVITFGSPVVGDPVPGVNYHIYAAQWDPVPMLSRYEDPALPSSLQQVAQEFPSIQTNYERPGWNLFSTHFWSATGRDMGATWDNLNAIKSGLLNGGPLVGDVLEDEGIMGINSLGINAKKSYMDPASLYGNSIQIVPDLTSTSDGFLGWAVHSHYGESTWLAGQQVLPQPPNTTTPGFLNNVEYFGMPNEYQTAQIDQYMKTNSSLGQILSQFVH